MEMEIVDVVAAILEHDNRILCMQRGESKYEYISFRYEFPGGKIDPGETRCQALMRELREELDLDIRISEDHYFDSVRHAYPDFSVTLHFFLCRVEDPAITLNDHEGYKWLERKDLLSLDWVPADEPIVRKLIG